MNDAKDRATLLAFLGIVLLGGMNGTAMKIANAELGPFWSGALRFGLASAIFFGIVALRRVPLPRGRQLVGSMTYGLLGFGFTFALASWALVSAPVGIAQIILALVPLVTLLLAVAQGIERFRLQSVAGSLVALGGVALVFADSIGSALTLLPLLAILLAVFAMSEANVVVKRLPHAHPSANNAVAMGTGASMLFGLALVFGDPIVIPTQGDTLLSLGYLVVIGTMVVFTLYLYVIERWTASATSYTMLLMPLVALSVAAVVLGEPITLAAILGGVLVLSGVYLGAFAPSLRRPLPGLFRRARRVAGASMGPPALETPNCP